MSRQLGRAMMYGLFAGLLGTSILLGVFAIRSAGFECETPGTEECVFESSTHTDIARLQSYASLGSGLIAAGLFLALRRRQAP